MDILTEKDDRDLNMKSASGDQNLPAAQTPLPGNNPKSHTQVLRA